MQRQLDLLATTAPAFDPEFAGLRRTTLAFGAWIDHVPSWVTGHDALFDELEQTLAWRRETMKMYDRVVDVPRLLASVPADHDLIEGMRAAISRHYAEEFSYVTAALYRDGNDSVAFHGDTTARDMVEARVATVSLGEPRKFLLKPKQSASGDDQAGASISLPLGRGDLVVMGGTCQRTWRHAIPKRKSAGPRIALMFRPAWASSYRRE